IVVGNFYLFITASLAELNSAIPTTGGAYRWASVTPGRNVGDICGFFAGYWNCLAYCFGVCSLASVSSGGLVQLYTLQHGNLEPQRWMVFICYWTIIRSAAPSFFFGNRLLPCINNGWMALVIGGWFTSIIIVDVLSGQYSRSRDSSTFV
ncbi:hypothetical protein K469DRAFT_771746, partial [Zopfia rhizophila CBS 207.26]